MSIDCYGPESGALTDMPLCDSALERAGLAESTFLPPHFSTFAYRLKKDQLAEPLHTLVDYYAAWVPFVSPRARLDSGLVLHPLAGLN